VAGILSANAEFSAAWYSIGANAVPLLLWINFASILCGIVLTVHCLFLSARISKLARGYEHQATLLGGLATEVGSHNELLRMGSFPPRERTRPMAASQAVDAETAATAAQIRDEIASLQTELQAVAPVDQGAPRPREVSLRLLPSPHVETRPDVGHDRPNTKKANHPDNGHGITLVSEMN
jgi:hypothetical protein